MAELAALGAAASVLQVIDFGTRFIKTAWQISRSDSGFLPSFQDLQTSSTSLREAQHKLQAMPTHPGSDTAINSLAEKSAVLSKQMLDSLEAIGRDDHGRKRDTLRKTWLTLWNESKVKSLDNRLKEVKVDLAFLLTVDIRTIARASLEGQQQMLLGMHDMRADIKALGDTISSTYDAQSGFGSLVLEHLTRGLEQHLDIKSELLFTLVDTIYKSEGQSGVADSSNIQLSQQIRGKLERMFIQRLRYSSIEEREFTIKDAHEGTFCWIFEGNHSTSAPSTGFKDWLQSDGNIYWITGKAGSGKSTLMKYLLQPTSQAVQQEDEATTADLIPGGTVKSHGRCEEYLQRWAGSEQKLTIASFHFWAIGSELQASQEGLFRTLLFQLLQAHPEVIPMVSPSRWESLCLVNEDPKGLSEKELGDMFRQAVIHISTRAKIALFIDGLDEFNGDCNALISLIQECVASPIKICVSSRPWSEFEDAFAHCPRLRMEDLTYQDIANYVVANFEADPLFRRLQRRQADVADNLTRSIAKRASGVFLWVTIVVASLLAGMGAGDRVEDLEKRLDVLPTEIQELYERILDSIDPLYLEHAAQLFRLMTSCKEPPSLMLLWYADETKFMDRVMNENPHTISDEEALERLDDMRRRLNSRCKGLLEVHQRSTSSTTSNANFGGSVGYLHKTVSEFICSDSTQRKLRTYLGTLYDAEVRISAAYAALVKMVLRTTATNRLSQFRLYFYRCLHHAANASDESSSEVVRLIDHLRVKCDGSYKHLLSGHPQLPLRRWQGEGLSMYEMHKAGELSLDQLFLCIATEMSVLDYVRVKVKHGGLVVANMNPSGPYVDRVFHTIARRLFRSEVSGISLLSLVRLTDSKGVAIIKLLLDNGANPNMVVRRVYGSDPAYYSATPWEGILTNAIAHVTRKLDTEKEDNLSKCLHLMIDRGARVSSRTVQRALILPQITPFLAVNSREPLAGGNFGSPGDRPRLVEATYQCLKHMKRDKSVKFKIGIEKVWGG